MFSIYSFKWKTVLVETIFTSLTLMIMAQSVHAQSIAAVRRAIVSNGNGSRIFAIDSSGRMTMTGDFIFEITRLGDDGSLEGKYYPAGKIAPPATNVIGTINILGRLPNTFRISFTVRQTGTPFPNETVYEGAIRLGGLREPRFGFMAGTFTNTVIGGVAEAVGPFPFCANLTSIPPG
jgi:hypothetical protein